MKLSTKFVIAMNDCENLEKVCNDLQKEKLRPADYHKECSMAIDTALISLVELKQAYYKKMTGAS